MLANNSAKDCTLEFGLVKFRLKICHECTKFIVLNSSYKHNNCFFIVDDNA